MIVHAKGCGFYLLAGLIGCVYQVIISPIQWADKTAQHMAKRLERGIVDGAEEDGGYGDGGAVAGGQYPDLSEVRRHEACYLH
jgi:hypothetical protein